MQRFDNSTEHTNKALRELLNESRSMITNSEI